MKPIALLLPCLCLVVPVAVAQWSTPVPVANVNSTAIDFYPAPTFDGLTLYFDSARLGNDDIWRATRSTPYGTFGAPTQVTELASPSIDGSPFARFGDLEIFFTSSRSGGTGGFDLWRADRQSTAVPFNTPVPVTELNTTALDWGPSLTLDGLRIYYSTNSAGTFDIWTATRPNWVSPFGTPTPVTELNTPSTERDPHISPDGLVVFFGSDRAGGLGSVDIWMASRVDPNVPFGAPVNVTALNSPSLDFTPGFSLFHDEIFLCSNRPGGPGAHDIYSSRFTGLTAFGIAGPGSSQQLRFADPSAPALPYVAVSSRGTSPGIPIDTRVLPLNFDLLMQLTIGGLPPILTGYVGALDQDGVGSGRISFAGFPQFVGLRFYTAFVVVDLTAPSGIKTISNAHEVLVQ